MVMVIYRVLTTPQKELNIKVSAKYTYTGTFNESPEIKTKATGWYNGGTDVIFACGGQICNSIFAAAEDTNKKVYRCR